MENSKLGSLTGLRICFIAGTLGMGGAERQLYLIISTLKSLGAEVSLISLKSGEFWEGPIVTIGINYYTLQGNGSKLKRLVQIISLLKKIRPDIVQSQHFYTNLYAAISGWFLKVISIGASRSDLNVEVKGNGIYGWALLMWPKFLLLNSMKSFEQALKMGRDKSRLFYLPNALDTKKFCRSQEGFETKRDPFILIAAGRLIRTKRFDKFIELVMRLNKEYNLLVKGILIGTGILEESLKQLAYGFGLSEDEMEFISGADKPEFYFQNGDLMVFCSDFEGTPNVVLEAMACGLPVITTKVGNLPFFINDKQSGFFFDGSVDNLTENVVEIMKHREVLRNISENAMKIINETFSVNALESNLVNIYKSIIN